MPTRKGNAVWKGDLPSGNGKVKFGSFEGNYSFKSRFEDGEGTNPEELIAAAHAGCFSMALANGLAKDDFTVNEINTEANLSLEKLSEGFRITKIQLNSEADVEGINEEEFLKYADDAKNNCPVSQALKSVEIKLDAKLK
mgnify:CR=1 FL=1